VAHQDPTASDWLACENFAELPSIVASLVYSALFTMRCLGGVMVLMSAMRGRDDEFSERDGHAM
jgi:hypothetical protein